MSESKNSIGEFFPLSLEIVDDIVRQGGNVYALISFVTLLMLRSPQSLEFSIGLAGCFNKELCP